MSLHKTARRLMQATLFASVFHFAPMAHAQTPTATPLADSTFRLTIFLKHDESKPLPQINQQLKEQGYFKQFPPPGMGCPGT